LCLLRYDTLCIGSLSRLKLLLLIIVLVPNVNNILGSLVLIVSSPIPVMVLFLRILSLLGLPGLSILLPFRVIKLDVLLMQFLLFSSVCFTLKSLGIDLLLFAPQGILDFHRYLCVLIPVLLLLGLLYHEHFLHIVLCAYLFMITLFLLVCMILSLFGLNDFECALFVLLLGHQVVL